MRIKVQNKYRSKVLNLSTIKYSSIEKSTVLKNINIKETIFNLLYQIKKIKGINYSTSFFLIGKIGMSPKNVSKISLKYEQWILKRIHNLIYSNNLVVGPVVKNNRKNNINKLKGVSNYRGLRHKLNLPLRGQRTCSNAKTRKKFRIF